MRSLVVLWSVVVVVGCSSSATKLHVTIDGAPAATDGYQLLFDKLSAITKPVSPLDIVIADSAAGSAMPLQVWAIEAGEQTSYGSTTVTPVLDSTVDVDLSLAPILCEASCQAPAPTCADASTLRSYTMTGRCADGSCAFGAGSTACPAPTNGTGACANAACMFSCNTGFEPSGTTCIPVAATSNNIDVLFVIDNSVSTTDKQTVLAANFQSFVTALTSFPSAGGAVALPSLHIGVITTSVDLGSTQGANCPSPNPTDNGLLQNTARVPGCMAPTGVRYISDLANADGTRTKNYSGTLDSELACIAQVGATGCGFEAPFKAIERALDGTTNPANAGFLRAGAYLAIVILTDEDDASVQDSSVFALGSAQAGPGDFRLQPLHAYTCNQPISATAAGTYTDCKVTTGSYLVDPQATVAFLETLKSPAQLITGVIAGPPVPTSATDALPMIMTGPLTQNGATQSLALLPSCTAMIGGNTAIARPGIRLDNFEHAFGARGVFETACSSDYSAALTAIGQLIAKTAQGK